MDELAPSKASADSSDEGSVRDWNPYTFGTYEHDLWKQKTRDAEEESARFCAEYIRKIISNRSSDPSFHCELHLRKITRLFDIWCARTLHFVSTDAEVDWFDEWLLKYVEEFIGVEFKSTPDAAIRGDAEMALQERVYHWQSEARKNAAEERRRNRSSTFLERTSAGPRHEAAIAAAESRLHAALMGDMPDRTVDWDGNTIPMCVALAAEYTRTVMQAYADDVLQPMHTDPHRRVRDFETYRMVITNYLFEEYFSPDVDDWNRERREKINSGEFIEGWYGSNGESLDVDRARFGIDVHNYSSISEDDQLCRWMDARVLQFWQSRAELLNNKVAAGGQTDTAEGRSLRRKSVILPLLQKRKLTPSGWAVRLGVDPSVVLDFLRGKSFPRPANAKLMSQDLGLRELPE